MAKGKSTPEYQTLPELEAARKPRQGTYYVMLPPCPRRIIETGLPAGPAAEAVARERYLHMYDLVPLPSRQPQMELLE